MSTVVAWMFLSLIEIVVRETVGVWALSGTLFCFVGQAVVANTTQFVDIT